MRIKVFITPIATIAFGITRCSVALRINTRDLKSNDENTKHASLPCARGTSTTSDTARSARMGHQFEFFRLRGWILTVDKGVEED
ncbi:hypothetical protein K503DRAFT_312309 [Rhizopogon vinicolor AM-OR11-026]|uniref:Uncharacterized protein n=1 Tax=Rhizopogon vinicolor AM-OR11-026 TaxID=1314800 RepID=A0A1B7MUN6_9AGAM|nr:hypothetical protein K503DRAFT_312309 [Rhizopogon vinicolor AM-OR11-026]